MDSITWVFNLHWNWTLPLSFFKFQGSISCERFIYLILIKEKLLALRFDLAIACIDSLALSEVTSCHHYSFYLHPSTAPPCPPSCVYVHVHVRFSLSLSLSFCTLENQIHLLSSRAWPFIFLLPRGALLSFSIFPPPPLSFLNSQLDSVTSSLFATQIFGSQSL